MTGGRGARGPAGADTAGVRVVLDARPLQVADRSPVTAIYLDQVLDAFDRTPLDGESFVFLLQSDLGDPTERFARLQVVGRRLMPPTRLLRSGALAVDPVLLRGASFGAAWRADRSGAAGAVYHAAGPTVPVLSRIPRVVTLLDLAPWQLPAVFQRGTAARYGQGLRARLLRDAAAVVVGTEAVARDARRLLHLRRDRVRVVRLAPRPAFVDEAGAGGARRRRGSQVDQRAERERLGLPERYLVYPGRFDARHDVRTLLAALADLAATERPAVLPGDVPWPPRVLLVGATPDDRAALARAAARAGAGDVLAYAPVLEPERLAALVRGARAAILPVLSDAAGIAALEALAARTPVVASSVGALPEIVGPAGMLVEPRDVRRLAAALATAWTDDAVHGRLVRLARERAAAYRRSWDDVAHETRAIYAEVGVRQAGDR